MTKENIKYKPSSYGPIPADWEERTIESDIDLLTGFPFPSNNYSRSGIRLLRGSNIKRGVTDWSEEITQYWPKVTPALKDYILENGDIVIAMDGSLVGRSFARLSSVDLPSLLLQRVARVRSRKIEMGYLKEFICSDYFTKHCDAVKTSSAIPHISPYDIRSFKIPIPPTLAEQTAIATALSDADSYIRSIEALIAKKRLIKQGAMQELLRPKEGWEMRKLGEIAEIIMGQSPLSEFYNTDESGLPLIQGNADIEERKTIIRTYTSSISKLGKIGDIIMTVRAPVGEIARAKFDCCLGRGVCAIRFNNSYLYHYLIYFENSWAKFSTGSTFDSVNSIQINSVEIPIPSSSSEQISISNTLDEMDNELISLERLLNKARQIKQGMMQQLLTGKIRLL